VALVVAVPQDDEAAAAVAAVYDLYRVVTNLDYAASNRID